MTISLENLWVEVDFVHVISFDMPDFVSIIIPCKAIGGYDLCCIKYGV